MAGKQQAAERRRAAGRDYWDAGGGGAVRGTGLPAHARTTPTQDGAGDSDDADDSGDAETDEPGPRKDPPELDDDAPPFATAPFAPVPRLNRVRSTPTPPADEDE